MISVALVGLTCLLCQETKRDVIHCPIDLARFSGPFPLSLDGCEFDESWHPLGRAWAVRRTCNNGDESKRDMLARWTVFEVSAVDDRCASRRRRCAALLRWPRMPLEWETVIASACGATADEIAAVALLTSLEQHYSLVQFKFAGQQFDELTKTFDANLGGTRWLGLPLELVYPGGAWIFWYGNKTRDWAPSILKVSA